jgi:hypothetical protein
MNMKNFLFGLILLGILVFAQNAYGDTFSTFQTTRYYSAKRHYFVEVTEKKRATLYRNERKATGIWSKSLDELPNKLFVTDDGSRVAIVDRYYGNGGSPSTSVVLIFDGNGKQIAAHSLGEVANLKRVPQTTSGAHWFDKVYLSDNQQSLLIETQTTKYDWDECLTNTPAEQLEKCFVTIPYQQLRFALVKGKLAERKDIALK